mmetsp:Transcript_13169/g.33409  ORF Transcript_13169/g.33409 Transcript_13169/m.33409 type:complete len:1166 (-) Transcript_13169:1719-5216(-)
MASATYMPDFSAVSDSVTTAASETAARISAALSDASYFESPIVHPELIRSGLNSPSNKLKTDALKRVLALVSLGKDASQFFPDVVKNVLSPSIAIKKLVYLYLVHYAEQHPDIALLSVNAFQKDLASSSPLVRALALKVLSSIRVRVILQIVVLAIRHAARDSSPYVRRVAAHAVPKVAALDGAASEDLPEILAALLADRDPGVMAAALRARDEVGPEEKVNEAVHPHFRKLCRAMPDMDEWDQIYVMNILTRYARRNFVDPDTTASGSGGRAAGDRDRGIAKDGGEASGVANGYEADDVFELSWKPTKSASALDPDLQQLLSSARYLFLSINPAVVLTAISLTFHLSPRAAIAADIVPPLLRLLHDRHAAIRFYTLRFCATVAHHAPDVLAPHVREFFVLATDAAPASALKVKILGKVCRSAKVFAETRKTGGGIRLSKSAVLLELMTYLLHDSKHVAVAAARAVGNIAAAESEDHAAVSARCIRALIGVISKSCAPEVVKECVVVLRRILQRNPAAHALSLRKVAAILLKDAAAGDGQPSGGLEAPEAKACVIWIIGEFFEAVADIASEVLRIFAKSFPKEVTPVKLEVMTLGAKIVGRLYENQLPFENAGLGPKCKMIFEYVLSMAKYDKDLTIRDQARLFSAVFFHADIPPTSPLPAAIIKSLIKPRPPPTAILAEESPQNRVDSSSGLQLGSFYHLIGREVPHLSSLNRRLPGWTKKPSDPQLRENKNESYTSAYEQYATSGGQTGIGSESYGQSIMSSSSVSVQERMEESSWRQPQNSQTFSKPHQNPRKLIDLESFYNDDEPQQSDESSSGEYVTDSEEESDEDGSEESEGARALPTAKPALAGLDDFLGDMNLPSENAQLENIPSSEYSRVVDPWCCGGLDIQVSYCFFMNNPHGNDAVPVKMKLTNVGKSPLLDLKIDKSETGKSEDDFDFTPTVMTFSFTPIPKLESDETREEVLFVKFPGRNVAVPLTVEMKTAGPNNDTFNVEPTAETFSIELRPSAGDILRPEPSLTVADFEVQAKRLAGMLTQRRKISIVPKDSSHHLASLTAAQWALTGEVQKRVLQSGRFAVIGGVDFKPVKDSTSENVVLRFAARVCGAAGSSSSSDKDIAIATVTVGEKASPGVKDVEAEITVACEEPLLSANLLQVLVNNFTKSGK